MNGTSTVRQGLRLIFCLAVLALAAAGLGHLPAVAQGGNCTQHCQAAYAKCYKDSGSNRRVCEAQLQQCLASCISKR